MIIVQVPLRISLLGGGTDLPEFCKNNIGCVVGSTINKHIYVILSKRFDNKIVISYSKQETVDTIDEIQHDLVREAARKAEMTNGFEIKTLAEIPSGGSGLGSSSAILVGLLKAFYEYREVRTTKYQLAMEAFDIERNILKRPIGYQDSFFASYGGKKKFTFIDNKVTVIELEQLQDFRRKNLFVFFSGITRKSSDILEKQVEKLDLSLYKELASLAQEYTEINTAALLSRAWEIKKQLSPNITNEAIDIMCEKAKLGGAKAMKLLGAGGGGFLLTFCLKSNIESLRKEMVDYKELDFDFVKYGARVVYRTE